MTIDPLVHRHIGGSLLVFKIPKGIKAKEDTASSIQ